MSSPSINRTGRLETYSYDDQVVRLFVIATIIWGALAMLFE
jgi:cbb3-type cytochrome oxidase subunit 1